MFFRGSLVVCVLSSLPVEAQNLQPLPAPARVLDQTGTLTGPFKNALRGRIAALENEKGAQLAVVIIPTTAPESIEAYSIRLAQSWGVGRKGVDDGVLLLVAKNDRKLRIEVGYGLEGAIPDAYAKRIIDQLITPEFASGNFEAGIDVGVGAIAGLIRDEEIVGMEDIQGDKRLQAKYANRKARNFNFWKTASYIVMVPCVIWGIILLFMERFWLAMIIPAAFYGLFILFLVFYLDDYFLPALFVLPIYAFALFIFDGFRNIVNGGGSSRGSAGYGSGASRGSYTSSSSSAGGSYSSSSSGSYSSSSSSSGGSYGGGSFGGGGASGSW